MVRKLALFASTLSIAIACDALVAAEYDWPHWRGPNRNGVVAEASEWDAGGWPLQRPIWETNVGIGSSSPIVVGDRVYLMGWSGNRDTLFCLDVQTGRTLWKTSYSAGKYGRHAAGDQGLYSGIISTPEYDGETGLVYTLGLDGQLNCWDTEREGAKVWEQEQCSQVCSPVIHSDHIYWVYKRPMCLDLKTGRTIWTGNNDCASAGSCLVTADSRLLYLAKRGELVLAETADRSPRQYRELARVGGLFRTDVWPHVVLSNRRILCKDRDGNVKYFQIGGSAAAKPPALAHIDPDRRMANVSNPTPPRKTAPSVDASDLKSWPGSTPGLVIAWRRDHGPGKIVSTVADSSDRWSLKTRGDAGFVGRGQAELAGGAVLVEGANETLLAACKQSGELSIEAVLLASKGRQTGPARIISFSLDPYRRNFTLGQEADELVLRLRTPRTGDNGMSPETRLFNFPDSTPVHVIVSYRDGELAAYRDGQRVKNSSAIRGDLSNWTPQHLLFGDEYQDSRYWHGLIERVAIHSRFIADDEARKRFELIRAKK